MPEPEIRNPRHGNLACLGFPVTLGERFLWVCHAKNVPHEPEKIKVMTLALCQPHLPPQNIRNDLFILSHSTKRNFFFSYLPSVGLMNWGRGWGEGGHDIECE